MFDCVYSLVRDFTLLTSSCKVNFIESLRSNFSVLLPNVDSLARTTASKEQDTEGGEEEEEEVVFDRVASYRNAFKIYTYFLLSIVVLEESNSSGNIVKVGVVMRLLWIIQLFEYRWFFVFLLSCECGVLMVF